jgi:DNA segregation ATPase FtsK/SpoIIIE, S-DNA-T family
VRDREIEKAKKRHQSIRDEITQRRDSRLAKIEEKYPARLRELGEQREADLAEAKQNRDRIVREASDKRKRELEQLRQRTEPKLTELRQRRDEQWRTLAGDWKRDINSLNTLREAIIKEDAAYFADWSDERWNGWYPPTTFPPALRFGRIDIDLNEFPGGVPDDERLPMPMPTQFTVPALLDFPARSSLLAQSAGNEGDPERSIAILQNTMLRC